ncbi:unnamed protein product [Menidia menidia]|uniref:(Atlantic silverside) hypothetical protein n=1 Tax=Menidia menidia TaxID=238744 RepID=A0A8S4BKV3_9TELE|nr:unnamed protein product [Menidia menidia]
MALRNMPCLRNMTFEGQVDWTTGTRGRTMKAGVGLFSALALFLLIGAVVTQRPRPKKPTRRPATTRRPSVLLPAVPEPREPTDFPPVILGPPSVYPDCPRECSCSPSYPNSLNCENRNIRVIPVIPLRTHYLYLQNNYISEVTAEPFKNATEVRWINLANNRIHRIDKQVFEKIPALLYLYANRNQLKEVPSGLPASLEQLRLDRNLISKIPAGALSKLENLTLLDLHKNQVNLTGINGTQICPFSLEADQSDNSLVPRLRYLRLDGNHLTPPIPMDVIMCFRHLHSIVI